MLGGNYLAIYWVGEKNKIHFLHSKEKLRDILEVAIKKKSDNDDFLWTNDLKLSSKQNNLGSNERECRKSLVYSLMRWF